MKPKSKTKELSLSACLSIKNSTKIEKFENSTRESTFNIVESTRVSYYNINTVFSMERLKIEEIANNYGMNLEEFSNRNVLADQINFALDFGIDIIRFAFISVFVRGPRSISSAQL